MKLPLPVATWLHKRAIEWTLTAAGFEPPQLVTDKFDDKTGKPAEAVTFPIDDMTWSDGTLKTFREAGLGGITAPKTYTVNRMWKRFPIGECEMLIVFGTRDGDPNRAERGLILAHDIPGDAWRLVSVVTIIDVPPDHDDRDFIERFMTRRMMH